MSSTDFSEAYARSLDQSDPLRDFRDRFYIPDETVYMDGNSLGLLSRASETALLRVLDEWKTLAIDGWLSARHPWFHFAERLGEMASTLVGAEPDEVVATGTTTVNIHALVSTFFRPDAKRNKILADSLNFPTDLYALQGQLKLRGLDPQTHLVLIPSGDGRILDEQRIIELMTDDVALIFLPSVLYRSGQLLDIPLLTSEAHKRSIPVGYDCSHSVGAVPHRFDACGVDFALWCSYKYLNSGPGATAFVYVNRRHFDREPGLAGWFGYVKEKQFDMLPDFRHQPNAGGWQISSPGILGLAPLEGSIEIIQEAGIEAIRAKSQKLTSYLIDLADAELSDPPYAFSVGTPGDPDKRSGHVALERDEDAWRICQALKKRSVVPDFRPPNVIRIAPVALYNTFHEVWKVVQHLKEIVDNHEYEAFDAERTGIT